MAQERVKRSVQVPLLAAAARRLAERFGQPSTVSGIPITEVRLPTLNFCFTPMGGRTILEIWDESRGGAKVLNIYCGPGDEIELLSFRRGDWEHALLQAARQDFALTSAQ